MHIADGVLGFEAMAVVSVISVIALIKAIKELKNEDISITAVDSRDKTPSAICILVSLYPD